MRETAWNYWFTFVSGVTALPDSPISEKQKEVVTVTLYLCVCPISYISLAP